MNETIGTIISKVYQDYQKTVILAVLMMVMSPMALNIYLLAERSGYVSNVYQVEHADLKKMAVTTEQTIRELKNELSNTRSASEDMAYYMLLTCKNTAQNPKDGDDCLKPKWMRKTP